MRIDRIAIDLPDYSGLLTGHYEKFADYKSVRPDGTDDWLLIATLNGSGRFSLGGEEIVARPGDLTLIQPWVEHNYQTDPDTGRWELLWGHFHARPAWMAWLQWTEVLKGIHRLHPSTEAWETIVPVFWKAHRLANTLSGYREALAMNALEELLLLCASSNSGDVLAMDERVASAIGYIQRSLSTKITLENIANSIHLSPSRCSHLFREQVGIPPLQYVNMLRIQRAKQMLERTNLTVGEIADQVGIEPFYLSRTFRLQTGRSPRDYRRHVAPLSRTQDCARVDQAGPSSAGVATR